MIIILYIFVHCAKHMLQVCGMTSASDHKRQDFKPGRTTTIPVYHRLLTPFITILCHIVSLVVDTIGSAVERNSRHKMDLIADSRWIICLDLVIRTVCFQRHRRCLLSVCSLLENMRRLVTGPPMSSLQRSPPVNTESGRTLAPPPQASVLATKVPEVRLFWSAAPKNVGRLAGTSVIGGGNIEDDNQKNFIVTSEVKGNFVRHLQSEPYCKYVWALGNSPMTDPCFSMQIVLWLQLVPHLLGASSWTAEYSTMSYITASGHTKCCSAKQLPVVLTVQSYL